MRPSLYESPAAISWLASMLHVCQFQLPKEGQGTPQGQWRAVLYPRPASPPPVAPLHSPPPLHAAWCALTGVQKACDVVARVDQGKNVGQVFLTFEQQLASEKSNRILLTSEADWVSAVCTACAEDLPPGHPHPTTRPACLLPSQPACKE